MNCEIKVFLCLRFVKMNKIIVAMMSQVQFNDFIAFLKSIIYDKIVKTIRCLSLIKMCLVMVICIGKYLYLVSV